MRISGARRIDDQILTVRDAAELLRISPRTLYVMVERDRIPFLRLGRLIRFEREALLEFMREAAR